MQNRLVYISLAIAIVAGLGLAHAQAPAEEPAEELNPLAAVDWTPGPTDGSLGNATIKLPEGFLFTGRSGAQKVMEALQNPLTNQEQGLIMKGGENSWMAIFEFDSVGYVDDEDKEDLDSDDILETLTEGTEASNEGRRARGWPEVHVTGWAEPPYYDESTNNLVWAVNVASEGSTTVNYNVRLLGRHGVMSATLLVGPEELAASAPEFNQALEGFSYNADNTYADYREGDKIAEYGLIGLMAGGAAAVALKSGLLGRFWKLLVVAGVAVAAAAKKLVSKFKGNA